MMTPIEHVGQMQNHWWWRPGWRTGRHFYACHFTMGDYDTLFELVQQYQESLKPFPSLDLIPRNWLHLTMQGIGFTDEIRGRQLTLIKSGIRARIARMPAPVVTFHKPVVRPEAVYLPAFPPEPIATLRDAVRSAISDILRPNQVELAAEHALTYRPHVSIAYSNATQPAEPVAQTLTTVGTTPVTVRLDQVDILEFHRDNRMYEWTAQREQLPIGR